MLAHSVPLALGFLHLAAAALVPAPIPDESPVHLGVALRLNNAAELDALLQRQQDPNSADFRRWLTAQEFGELFGQSPEVYERAAQWMEAEGFTVTRFPNRSFLEGQGSAGQVNHLLGLHLRSVAGHSAAVHIPDQPPAFPDALSGVVLHVSGLDTQSHFKHRLVGTTGRPSFGPQDLRRFYGVQPLLDRGYVGQGQKLAVLSEAETEENSPSAVAINYFLQNISDASAAFSQDVIPNPSNDFDQEGGGAVEFSLDVEMQSVGAPGADSITLVVSPASEVFSTGVNHIVNDLETVTAVSVSLGSCEPAVKEFEGPLMTSFQQALKQGLSEGQTWSAASGDNGSDDCQDGTTEAIDFPASIPQMVAMGGAEVASPNWDTFGALTAYQQETGWNDGSGGGAGGGGVSILYSVPSYQQGLSDGGRSVPDLALIAGLPGVLSDEPIPGQLYPIEGTSVASPLSAGFFALIASRVGCRLGDVHSVLYALGNAQLDGGAQVFNDIVSGTAAYDGVPGPSAGPGYDSVTGWGSVNLEALADAWPPCPSDGGFTDAGPVAPYDQCGILACAGSAACTTLPEGPSSCLMTCDPVDAGICTVGTICSTQTLFSGDAGVCVPGCHADLDCADAGEVCSTCEGTCAPPGNSSAKMGDACVDSNACPNGAFCASSRGLFQNGYCTQSCVQGASEEAACGCPSGSVCGQIGFFQPSFDCLLACSVAGESCGQAGYVCQPVSTGNECLPICSILSFGGNSFDTCNEFGSAFACDTDTGVCDKPIPDGGAADAGQEDGGVDAGDVDAGARDAGDRPDSGSVETDDGGEIVVPDAGSNGGDGGTLVTGQSGCSCSPGVGGPDALWGLIGWAAILRRRRVARPGRSPKVS
jgi:uncharacterized protein (TIGR03382 family)